VRRGTVPIFIQPLNWYKMQTVTCTKSTLLMIFKHELYNVQLDIRISFQISSNSSDIIAWGNDNQFGKTNN